MARIRIVRMLVALLLVVAALLQVYPPPAGGCPARTSGCGGAVGSN